MLVVVLAHHKHMLQSIVGKHRVAYPLTPRTPPICALIHRRSASPCYTSGTASATLYSDASCCTINSYIRMNCYLEALERFLVMMVSTRLPVSWLLLFAIAGLAAGVANMYYVLSLSRQLLSGPANIIWAWLTGVLSL